MEKIIIRAYAKINLTLDIFEKGEDGYHNISSVFQAVGLFDTLTISKSESYRLTGCVVCPPESNLVTRAKEALEEFADRSLPCEIGLMKSIPVCAGLGGGSSDAAAALVGISELYGLGLGCRELAEIGVRIGSDIPFFLSGAGTALVEGKGEKVRKIRKDVSAFYILARPHKRISTEKIYALYDEKGKPFVELASEICPDIGRLIRLFSPLSPECGMSGSGPTVFAGFQSYEKAALAAKKSGILDFNGDLFICPPTEVPLDMRKIN